MTEAKSEKPILYIFSGLPGSGKTTLSQRVAQSVHAVYLRIDTIEQALRELCSVEVQGEGYRLVYRIAADNLRVGMSVVADSCNPIELTRREWERVALDISFAIFVWECHGNIESSKIIDCTIKRSCWRTLSWLPSSSHPLGCLS